MKASFRYLIRGLCVFWDFLLKFLLHLRLACRQSGEKFFPLSLSLIFPHSKDWSYDYILCTMKLSVQKIPLPFCMKNIYFIIDKEPELFYTRSVNCIKFPLSQSKICSFPRICVINLWWTFYLKKKSFLLKLNHW